jgi:hypothetical protein
MQNPPSADADGGFFVAAVPAGTGRRLILTALSQSSQTINFVNQDLATHREQKSSTFSKDATP